MFLFNENFKYFVKVAALSIFLSWHASQVWSQQINSRHWHPPISAWPDKVSWFYGLCMGSQGAIAEYCAFPFHLLYEIHVPVSLGFRAVQWLSLHVLKGHSVSELQVWDSLWAGEQWSTDMGYSLWHSSITSWCGRCNLMADLGTASVDFCFLLNFLRACSFHILSSNFSLFNLVILSLVKLRA